MSDAKFLVAGGLVLGWSFSGRLLIFLAFAARGPRRESTVSGYRLAQLGKGWKGGSWMGGKQRATGVLHEGGYRQGGDGR